MDHGIMQREELLNEGEDEEEGEGNMTMGLMSNTGEEIREAEEVVEVKQEENSVSTWVIQIRFHYH